MLEMKKFILVEGNVLSLVNENGRLRFPEGDEIEVSSDAEPFCFGDYIACPADKVSSECSLEPAGVREAWKFLSEEEYAAVVKGAELLHWSESERFCGRDGSRLERAGVISKRCPECGSEYFPRLNPAIVVLVKRGDEALLVHARNFRGDMMALVAGFVETGETLEECVVREIKEETTLDVRNVRYIGSQSWPFPHQLMIGFTADYAGGEIDFADGELYDGRFFSRDRVPELPTMPSLSRRIIDLWIEGKI